MHTLRRYFESQIGFDPSEELELTDWLTVPEQKLLEVTAGCVYHDGLGKLEEVRARLARWAMISARGSSPLAWCVT